MSQLEYRRANESDLAAIIPFVDFWIRGDGLADKVPGSAHDFFVPRGRHIKYLKKYNVLLAFFEGGLVGWAVTTHKGVLIHLLVAGTFRHAGIGSRMLELMNPDTIRSKMDQSAGNPADFYLKSGYVKSPMDLTGKNNNIELFHRALD